MTIDEIETFLAIIETGSITAAANKLYVGQTTVSHRVRLLEDELGVSLFARQKGKRSVALTAAGENFIPIAHQWLSLWRDTQNLQSRSARSHVCVGSVDLINNYTFVPLYKRILAQHPEICLDIRTHHSDEVPLLLSNHTIDIGFVFSQVNLPDICSRPIYRELMYLVCGRAAPYHDEIDAAELSPRDEIYLNWGSELEAWHRTYWPSREYLIKVNTGSLISHYLTDAPNRWAVVPMSLVSALKADPNIVSYTLKNPPPPRICYQLTHRFPKPNMAPAIAQVLRAMDAFIDESSAICAYKPWMSRQQSADGKTAD